MKTEKILPYLLVLPTVLYLFVFLFNPFLNIFKLAFFNEEGFTFGYFSSMFQDPRFIDALKYTVLFTITIVPFQLITALLIAIFINTGFRGSKLLLYICALPLAISDLATGLIFLSIFTEYGFLNSILYFMRIINNPIYFLSYENITSVFLSIFIAEHWRATAIVLLILLAGLQMVKKDYLEAAELFGAGFFKKLFYVIIPLLKPSIQSALIIRTIFAFQMFAVVLALSGEIIPVFAGESYFWYYVYRNPNIASAYAILIIIFSLLMTVLYIRLFKIKGIEYA